MANSLLTESAKTLVGTVVLGLSKCLLVSVLALFCGLDFIPPLVHLFFQRT